MRTEGGVWKIGFRVCILMCLLTLLSSCASTRNEDDLFFLTLMSMSTAPGREGLLDPRIQNCPDPRTTEHGRTQYINLDPCVTNRFEIFVPYVMNLRLVGGKSWINPYSPQSDLDGLDGAGNAVAKLTRVQNFSRAACPRFIPVPGNIECVRSFRTRLDYPLEYAGLGIGSHRRGPCRQGSIRFKIEIPNPLDLYVKEIRFESVQPCS